MFMEWRCICVEVSYNSDVEESDCTSYKKKSFRKNICYYRKSNGVLQCWKEDCRQIFIVEKVFGRQI